MTQTYIYLYIAAAFVGGFILAWIIRTVALVKIKKSKKSTEGYLESEKLMKETLQKENTMVHQTKESIVLDLTKKLRESRDLNKMLDESILLLQKSNEETEALMKAGMPALHDLKLKLIEAQNTVARLKSQGELKETTF
ncbi:MAG: hypothetical protein ABIN94_01325 [Ferruginibacter sp.]